MNPPHPTDSPRSFRRRCLVFCAGAVLLDCVCAVSLHAAQPALAPATAPAESPHLAALRAAGIEPTPAGVSAYLRSLDADPNFRHGLEHWAQQLDADSFADREAATLALLRTPVLPPDWLTAKSAAASPEARWRLHRVTQHQSVHSGGSLRAVFALVQEHPAAYKLDDLLAAAVVLQRPDVAPSYARALRKLAAEGDLADLRRAAAAPSADKRAAAAMGLAVHHRAEARQALVLLADDRAGPAALAACAALADIGERAVLERLVRLLEAEELQVRSDAARILAALAAHDEPFDPAAGAAQRQAGAAAWRNWLQTVGRTAPLFFPPRISQVQRRSLAGRTLLATGGLGRVVELDAAGEETFAYPIKSWSVEPLASGNLLIASHWRRTVLEVDPSGGVVWSLDEVDAIRAKPLWGGNVLVADIQRNRAVEYDRQRQIVWQYEAPEQVFDAERLHGGETLIACPNVIRQVSADGLVTAEWTQPGRINSLQLLPTGNLLLANYGQGAVVELDRTGKEVWRAAVERPTDAFRSRNGATLVATSERLVELDAAGKLVRELASAQSGCVRQ